MQKVVIVVVLVLVCVWAAQATHSLKRRKASMVQRQTGADGCTIKKTYGQCEFNPVNSKKFKLFVKKCYYEETTEPFTANLPTNGQGFKIGRLLKEFNLCCSQAQSSYLYECHVYQPTTKGSGTHKYTDGWRTNQSMDELVKKYKKKDQDMSNKKLKLDFIKRSEADNAQTCQDKLATLLAPQSTPDAKKEQLKKMEVLVINIIHQIISRSSVKSLGAINTHKQFLTKKTLARVVYRLFKLFGWDDIATPLSFIKAGEGEGVDPNSQPLKNHLKALEQVAEFYELFESRDAIKDQLTEATENQILLQSIQKSSTNPVQTQPQQTQPQQTQPQQTPSQQTQAQQADPIADALVKAEKSIALLKSSLGLLEKKFKHKFDNLIATKKQGSIEEQVATVLFPRRTSENAEHYWGVQYPIKTTCPMLYYSMGIESQGFAKHNYRNTVLTKWITFAMKAAVAVTSAIPAPMGGAIAKFGAEALAGLGESVMASNNEIRALRRELRQGVIGAYQAGMLTDTGKYQTNSMCLKQAIAFLDVAIEFLFKTKATLNSEFQTYESCVQLSVEVNRPFDQYIPFLDLLAKAIPAAYEPVKWTPQFTIINGLDALPEAASTFIEKYKEIKKEEKEKKESKKDN